MSDQYINLGVHHDYYTLYDFTTFRFLVPQIITSKRLVRQLNGGENGRVFSWTDKTGDEIQRNTVRAGHSCLAITPDDAPLTTS